MERTGQTLNGRYQLERLLGRGGFAEVYLATDHRLHRQVAVKVLDPAPLSATRRADFLRRFSREAKTVAALDHPHILAVYDYGEDTTLGVLYLVMPYVAGGSLDRRLEAAGVLSPHAVTPLLQQLAAALDHAHRRDIIHRDLKPQNILLRAEDDRLLLADFGIAKLLREATQSQSGAIVGTLAYMAPEQFAGQVGRPSDVYALGCVLFELLSGEVPYSGGTERIIYSHLHEPVPSLVERSGGRVPSTIAAVVERALAKIPAARYPTAGSLAAAFAAALVGDQTIPFDFAPISLLAPTVVAPPPTVDTPRPPLIPLKSRRSLQLALAGLGIALTVTLVALGLRFALTDRNAMPTPTVTVAAVSIAPTPVAALATPPEPVPVPTRAIPATGQATPTRGTPTSIAARSTPSVPFAGVRVATLEGHTNWVQALAWSPDGQTLASGSDDGTIRLWRPDGTLITIAKGHTLAVNAVAWSPDGQLLASSSRDRTARIWRADGTLLWTMTTFGDSVRAVAWSPDSQILATGAWDNSVQLWHSDGTRIASRREHTGAIWALAWSPNGQTLASASDDDTVRLWRPDGTPLATLAGHTDWVRAVSWSPDGSILASASGDGTARLWRANGSELAVLAGHKSGIRALAWSPDGQTLATGSADATIRLWRPDGSLARVLEGHYTEVPVVAWSPDGKLLASTSVSSLGNLRLWSAEGVPYSANTEHIGGVFALAWSPDGSLLASGGQDKTVRLWR